jgi:hypothetical protein
LLKKNQSLIKKIKNEKEEEEFFSKKKNSNFIKKTL